MSKQMKLIMENWNSFLNEQFEACDTPFKVGDMVLSIDIMKVLDDQEALNKREQEIANSQLAGYLERAKQLATPLAKLGIAAVSATTPVGAMGTAITAATWAAIADDAADITKNIFLFGSQNEEEPKYKQFLDLFCVDQETLDLVDDKYQQQYVSESDIVQQLKAYFGNTANANNPLPDITNHLVDWLNTKSDYKNSDDTQLVSR